MVKIIYARLKQIQEIEHDIINKKALITNIELDIIYLKKSLKPENI